MEPNKTYVKNCYIQVNRDVRDDGRSMFELSDEHGVQCCLEGYAIIPLSEFKRLRDIAGHDPDNCMTVQSMEPILAVHFEEA